MRPRTVGYVVLNSGSPMALYYYEPMTRGGVLRFGRTGTLFPDIRRAKNAIARTVRHDQEHGNPWSDEEYAKFRVTRLEAMP